MRSDLPGFLSSPPSSPLLLLDVELFLDRARLAEALVTMLLEKFDWFVDSGCFAPPVLPFSASLVAEVGCLKLPKVVSFLSETARFWDGRNRQHRDAICRQVVPLSWQQGKAEKIIIARQ